MGRDDSHDLRLWRKESSLLSCGAGPKGNVETSACYSARVDAEALSGSSSTRSATTSSGTVGGDSVPVIDVSESVSSVSAALASGVSLPSVSAGEGVSGGAGSVSIGSVGTIDSDNGKGAESDWPNRAASWALVRHTGDWSSGLSETHSFWVITSGPVARVK